MFKESLDHLPSSSLDVWARYVLWSPWNCQRQDPISKDVLCTLLKAPMAAPSDRMSRAISLQEMSSIKPSSSSLLGGERWGRHAAIG